MKIGYDAKRFFSNSSGLGNYSRDLIRILLTYFPENQYLLFAEKKTEKGADILQNSNVSFCKSTSAPLARQFNMGMDAQKLDAQIFHGLSGELPLKWNSKKIKKIVTIHDLIFLRYPQFYSFFDRKIHYWKFKKAAESADLIIAISEQTKWDIQNYLKIPEEKIRVVYQGCHHSFKEIQSEEFTNEIKIKYNLPQRFVLNVGTIEPRKNLLNLIKALEGTDIPLVVIGKKQKKYFEKITKFIKNKRVKIQFLTGVSMEELAGIYKLAEIFIYPSFFEGFGIPVIEALFSGTPVITSNTSSLPEAGGKDSLYINPTNPDDIRAKVLHLWDSTSKRNLMSEKGKIYVQNFADEIIAGNLMNLYRELVGK